MEAPAALRARIEAQRRGRRVEVPRRLLVIGASATAVLAVAIGLSVFRSDTSPEQFRAALAPTALLPDASGDATLTKTSSGWRIELDATGLPRLENGRYYQAWLRNTAGVLVPIGTFNEGRKVTLWAGVPPTDFTTSASRASRPTAISRRRARRCSSERSTPATQAEPPSSRRTTCCRAR